MKIIKWMAVGLLMSALGACGDDSGEVGPPGPAGQDGRAGQDGEDGRPGMDGRDGEDAPVDLQSGPSFRDHDGILTDPMLTGPDEGSVFVVWYTEFAGESHELFYGERLEQSVTATTTKMSRLFEDAESEILGRSTPTTTSSQAWVVRDVWRHEARATGLDAGVRVPYVARSTVNGVSFTSRTFSLQPLPAPDQPVKILLTSDQQNRAMSPANFEKVVETVGHIDAVLFAGDFVDHPNRASEWFDRDDQSRPAFFPALQGRFQEMFPNHPYRGGEILQHAPVFGSIGNHESPGRIRNDRDLNGIDGEPRPRWYAEWQWSQLTEEERQDLDRDTFVRDNSFEHTTYYEMWNLPRHGVDGEEPENFYALRYGNVHIISMNVSRVWRNWNNGFNNGGRGKFSEPSLTINDLDTWGFGDMFFQDYSPGSPQRDWLAERWTDSSFQEASFRVVLGHQTMFGHGDNAVPVMANPEATITFTDGRQPIVTRFPADERVWNQIVEAATASVIETAYYRYPRSDDLWLGVEAELLEAGVHLVHTGHSHTWNRSFVESASGHRLNYLETSNVGNTFGPTVDVNPRVRWALEFYPSVDSGDTRDPTFWDPADYVRFGDPQGRPDVPPSRVPEVDVMRDIEGGPEGLPFISSNGVTVFSILDSGDGTVRSYAHDTEFPRSPAVEVDCFPLESGTSPNPCDP